MNILENAKFTKLKIETSLTVGCVVYWFVYEFGQEEGLRRYARAVV